jgi:hypothetical protein
MAHSDVAVHPEPHCLHHSREHTPKEESGLLYIGPPDRWNITTGGALVCLVVVWGWQFYSSWGAWGNLTIDSGHEMYIPLLLAQGKMLYRDVWFNFGPLAPYFNSYLFRLFGIHLSVLYWAGSLAALGSAVFLYLTGMQLSVWPIGWTAGAVILLEGFQPSLFNFPLPYSFSAAYGCFVACASLYLFTKLCSSPKWGWMFAAGCAAATALLLKPEFGAACYVIVAALILIRGFQSRSAKPVLQDVAAIVPGIAVCIAVVLWMISIRGVEFLTQENIDDWPTSFFMTHYASNMLQVNGFPVKPSALTDALVRSLFPAGFLLALYCFLKWKRWDTTSILMRLGLLVVLPFTISTPEAALTALVFPRDMVLYVLIAAAFSWWVFWGRNPANSGNVIIPILLTFSGLLAFRIMLRMLPKDYPIYYNGPVVLCFLLLVLALLSRSVGTPKAVWKIESAFCVVCLLAVGWSAHQARTVTKSFVPLTTDRGTILVPPHMKDGYEIAMRFMKEKAASGEYVLSVPEDTSLYFLSGTYCPTRVYMFLPGIMAPGPMTNEFIKEMENKKVRYLLWSNRLFWEYGVPIFGRDFDRQIGDYFRSHYHLVGPLTPNTGSFADWTVSLWVRNDPAN